MNMKYIHYFRYISIILVALFLLVSMYFIQVLFPYSDGIIYYIDLLLPIYITITMGLVALVFYKNNIEKTNRKKTIELFPYIEIKYTNENKLIIKNVGDGLAKYVEVFIDIDGKYEKLFFDTGKLKRNCFSLSKGDEIFTTNIDENIINNSSFIILYTNYTKTDFFVLGIINSNGKIDIIENDSENNSFFENSNLPLYKTLDEYLETKKMHKTLFSKKFTRKLSKMIKEQNE